MFGVTLNTLWVIVTHLKLWVAVATRNFNWVKIQIIYLSGLNVNNWMHSVAYHCSSGSFDPF